MLNSSHQTMSRQAQLPPRCPFQRKPISSPTNSSIHNYFPRHHKSPSQGSILEDQPAWLDDLLNDQEVSSKSGGTHRRSSSDSVVDALPSLNLKQNPAGTESQGRLELDCTYGPNSPRARSESAAFSDNGIVSALSEYISQNPLQVLDGSLCIAGAISSDASSDVHGVDGDHNTEMKPVKRHSGQRSRVRKLQYIAELEKTVEVFQAFESELAVKVAALLQQRVTLTMENAKLKQKMTRLRQEKLFMEGQYQSLRKEADRLRANLARSPNRHARSYSDTSIAARAGIGGEAAWHTSLDLDKLNLNN